MNKNLSVSERIQNAFASTEVERVMAVHAYLHAASRSREEWSTVWSKEDDVSWAHGFGRMRGFLSVWSGSVIDYDISTYEEFRDTIRSYPQMLMRDPRPLMVNSMHPLTNSVIEVAENGETARCTYYTPGLLYAILNADKHRFGAMLWERYGADFRKENGEWKYIHDQVCPDFMAPFDGGNSMQMAYMQTKYPERFPQRPVNQPSHLEDPGPLHENRSPVQPVQNTVPWPVPYKKLDNNNTFTKCSQYDD